MEKACGHKVLVFSCVSGEGVPTVLRAMAREIARRRQERADARPQPVRIARTRAERQSVNYQAPVVPPSPKTAEAAPPRKAKLVVKRPARVSKRAAGLALAKSKTAKAEAKPVVVAKPKAKKTKA